MFIRVKLEEIYDINHTSIDFFSKRQQRDLQIILKHFEEESITIPEWHIFEIIESSIRDTCIYYLSTNDDFKNVAFHISKNGTFETLPFDNKRIVRE